MFAQLDTPGGHTIVCLLMVLIGAGFFWLHIAKGEDLIIGSSAALFAVTRGLGGGKINGNP